MMTVRGTSAAMKTRRNGIGVMQPAAHDVGVDRASWDTLRLFLAVVEAGSFRSAANVVGISINTIRSKVDQLERQIGGPLLRRSVEGVVPTANGYEILQIARDMRALGRATSHVRNGPSPLKDRALRMSVDDGIGISWLAPLIDELANGDPRGIGLDLAAAGSDVLFRTTDIAVQLTPPTAPGLVVEPIAVLHMMPFAAASYVERFGLPKTVADAAKHRWVVRPQDLIAEELQPLFGTDAERSLTVAVTVSSFAAHHAAVASGAGIGFMPSYAQTIDRRLQPVDIGVSIQRDVFLVRHAESADAARVGAACDWLHRAFDVARHPWFSENFVHPGSFAGEAHSGGGTVVPFASGGADRHRAV